MGLGMPLKKKCRKYRQRRLGQATGRAKTTKGLIFSRESCINAPCTRTAEPQASCTKAAAVGAGANHQERERLGKLVNHPQADARARTRSGAGISVHTHTHTHTHTHL